MLTDEQAKATQELAKTTREGIGAVRDASSFFGRFIEGPLQQASGMLEDKLKFMRFERLVRFQNRTVELMEANGMDAPTREVPANYLVGVLEAGSLEENDELQEMWAKLLVNAADAESDSEPRHAFISMLKDMTHLDAQILRNIVEFDGEHVLEGGYYNLQDICGERFASDEIQLSIHNLLRLNCVSPANGWGGVLMDPVEVLKTTTLALAFVQACTLRSDMTE